MVRRKDNYILQLSDCEPNRLWLYNVYIQCMVIDVSKVLCDLFLRKVYLRVLHVLWCWDQSGRKVYPSGQAQAFL